MEKSKLGNSFVIFNFRNKLFQEGGRVFSKAAFLCLDDINYLYAHLSNEIKYGLFGGLKELSNDNHARLLEDKHKKLNSIDRYIVVKWVKK